MKIYKTAVIISGDPSTRGSVYKMDTIEHEGQMWLVPEWIDIPGEGWSTPVRIIRLDGLAHQKSAHRDYDYFLNNPLPKSVFDGEIPTEVESEYVVIENPNIKVPRTH